MLTEWGLAAINAPEVWRHGIHGQGVTVAVIDSGIDVHADLLPNVWVNEGEVMNGRDDDGNGYVDDLNGWNFVDDNNNPIGTHNHGTHVSGTIAADRNEFGTTGVAYRAKIMPLRVFDESGVGNTSDIADAIRYAVSNGADIINLSIGGTATRSLNLALEYAAKENVLVVAASGNESASEPVFPAIHSAKWPHILSVGAHDQSFQAVKTSNSVGSSKAVQVDAPGISITSTVTKNQFGKKGGTSSAAAHVAGVAALMISANDNLTAAELRGALVASVSRRVEGSDSAGAVNALRAVALVSGAFTGRPFTVIQEADFNDNGTVDFDDFLRLAKSYGKESVDHRSGDADGDGEVDFADFIVLAQTYGDDIPQHARRENSGVAIVSASALSDVLIDYDLIPDVPVETEETTSGADKPLAPALIPPAETPSASSNDGNSAKPVLPADETSENADPPTVTQPSRPTASDPAPESSTQPASDSPTSAFSGNDFLQSLFSLRRPTVELDVTPEAQDEEKGASESGNSVDPPAPVAPVPAPVPVIPPLPKPEPETKVPEEPAAVEIVVKPEEPVAAAAPDPPITNGAVTDEAIIQLTEEPETEQQSTETSIWSPQSLMLSLISSRQG